MSYKRFNRRFISLATTVCLLFSFLVPFVVPDKAMAADQAVAYTAQELAAKAIKFINDRYQAGEKIDGYTAYILTLAGENLEDKVKWTKNEETLKSSIEKLADLLGNNNSLITYIMATQNADGSFGPLANDYGTKAPLQALALVKPDLPVNDPVYNQVQDSISKAVSYFKNRYQNGSLTYEVNGWNFDYRCVEALVNAGEDLSGGGWVYNGKSLKNVVIASAEAAASNPSVLDAVYLAKELTALYAVDPTSSYINMLADAIIAKQKTTNGTIYFGNSIYDDVTVLTALGKAGRLSVIDQVYALNYLNGFKHEHKNAWGQPAGAAWSGYTAEEPDLTAQVLTALSYFDGAKVEGSDVYKTIQEGLAYLKDIQDVDTGAIPAQWDSTFSTAETLIALKSLGKTYNDYAGSSSPWVKRSRTKTIAQCLLALNRWGDTVRVNKLANLLKERHSPNGFDNSVYSDMWAYIALGEAGQITLINDVYAHDYILGKQSVAEATYGAWGEAVGNTFYPDFMSTAQAIRALTYLPGYQQNDPQIQSAIDKGLAYLKKWLQPDGSVYYRTESWAEDPVVDTTEVIITLKRLGHDLLSWRSPTGLSPVSYMMLKALNDDGSFGAYRNVLDASEALYTYLILAGTIDPRTSLGLLVQPAAASLNLNGKQQFKAVLAYFDGTRSDVTNEAVWSVGDTSIASVSDSDYGLVTALNTGQTVVKAIYNGLTATAILNITLPTSSTPDRDYCIVDIAVVGMNGELLYGPGSVMVSKNGRWGLTALGALDATGLSYVDDNGFVKSIAGQANSGMNGWMYKVNGSVPIVGASQKAIQEGDQIIWWYSTDWSSSGPVWESLVKSSTSASTAMSVPADLKEQNKKLPVALQAPQVAVDALAKINQLLELTEGTFQIAPLSEVKKAVVVTGGEKAMSRAEIAALRKELAQNQIDLAQKVTASAGAIITDAKEEIALSIPAEALQNDLEITIKKNTVVASAGNNGGNAAQAPPPAGYQQISAIYNFGPDGTTFNIPVTLNLKIALPPLAKPENLALAWYDKTKGQWVAIPAVVDMSKGLILARINHFSDYAVFAKEARKSFEDVTNNSFAWAKDTIETLAGAGIVAGVDSSRFEPGRAVTRAEFASLLVKALGLEVKEGTKNPFKDVKGDAWYAGAVTAAAGNGLVKGYEDGTFRPEKTITREEVAVMLVRAMNLPEGEEKLSFKDNDKVSAWARKSVGAAAAHGLVKGFEDGTFRPGEAASRAECAVMVYRMLVAE